MFHLGPNNTPQVPYLNFCVYATQHTAASRQELESVSFFSSLFKTWNRREGIGNNGKRKGKEGKCEKRRINHHLLIASDFWMAISTLYQTLLLDIPVVYFQGTAPPPCKHETNGRLGPRNPTAAAPTVDRTQNFQPLIFSFPWELYCDLAQHITPRIICKSGSATQPSRFCQEPWPPRKHRKSKLRSRTLKTAYQFSTPFHELFSLVFFSFRLASSTDSSENTHTT